MEETVGMQREIVWLLWRNNVKAETIFSRLGNVFGEYAIYLDEINDWISKFESGEETLIRKDLAEVQVSDDLLEGMRAFVVRYPMSTLAEVAYQFDQDEATTKMILQKRLQMHKPSDRWKYKYPWLNGKDHLSTTEQQIDPCFNKKATTNQSQSASSDDEDDGLPLATFAQCSNGGDHQLTCSSSTAECRNNSDSTRLKRSTGQANIDEQFTLDQDTVPTNPSTSSQEHDVSAAAIMCSIANGSAGDATDVEATPKNFNNSINHSRSDLDLCVGDGDHGAESMNPLATSSQVDILSSTAQQQLL